ncbi:DUF2938 domain-containing protein [Klebsiella sp. BIGb0407]|uniref:DUF2938 domain-containing protein n=1 Tax=Klebsiella sp. BIGb0407 TaxID=2940603 RepID=UPI00216A1C8E|nr:DUF2938 domain-containing protein [Klebsiella sp. BIGb0407]MCS3432641.1 hypothetical protein [Klebsiella sp. BIGb0407]
MITTEVWLRIVLTGIGATVVMDIGAIIQRAMKMPTLDYALVGRWAGHICRGQWAHNSIAKAPAIRGELVAGWVIHYFTGILFAALLVTVEGSGWLFAPTLLPAVLVGSLTVVMPFLVMQPAMGAGIAASRTPSPWVNRLRSLLNHAIFGLGLYLSAVLTVWLS